MNKIKTDTDELFSQAIFKNEGVSSEAVIPQLHVCDIKKVPRSALCCNRLMAMLSFLYIHFLFSLGFPGSASGKEPACQCRRLKRCRFDPWVRKIPWRRAWQSTLVFLPGDSYGQRSLVGSSPQYLKEPDMTDAESETPVIWPPDVKSRLI